MCDDIVAIKARVTIIPWFIFMSWGLVASRWPEIRSTASALHTYGLIRIISKILSYKNGNSGKKLHFVSPHATNEHTDYLREHFGYVLLVWVFGSLLVYRTDCWQCPPNTSSFDEFLEQTTPEVVFFDRFIMEEQFAWKLQPSTFRILDTQDLHFLRQARWKYVKEQGEMAPEVC